MAQVIKDTYASGAMMFQTWHSEYRNKGNVLPVCISACACTIYKIHLAGDPQRVVQKLLNERAFTRPSCGS
jgi:hypothetical protein